MTDVATPDRMAQHGFHSRRGDCDGGDGPSGVEKNSKLHRSI